MLYTITYVQRMKVPGRYGIPASCMYRKPMMVSSPLQIIKKYTCTYVARERAKRAESRTVHVHLCAILSQSMYRQTVYYCIRVVIVPYLRRNLYRTCIHVHLSICVYMIYIFSQNQHKKRPSILLEFIAYIHSSLVSPTIQSLHLLNYTCCC